MREQVNSLNLTNCRLIIDFAIIDKIAELKPFKVVFKDASFKDDKDRINVQERFKRLSPATIITVH